MISLKGPTLGGTVVRVVFVVLLLVLAVQVLGGRLGWWRAGVWKERAEEQRDIASQAQAEANSANAGAQNATETRQRVDLVLSGIPSQTEASAQRIEQHADRPAPVADLDPIDPAVVRELEDGEARVRAASDRLQRTGTGRTNAAPAEPRRAAGD